MYIKRNLEEIIESKLNKGKVINLYGARRVGKTTLLRDIFKDSKYLYLSCEQQRIKEMLIPDSLSLKKAFGDYKTIILDEAQYLDNPGLILKILIDSYPDLNIIATGSSSFDLANKVNEPLTGRYFKYTLYPISISEIRDNFPTQDQNRIIEDMMIFGSYPELFNIESKEEKISYITDLADSYLYKDILAFNLIKDSKKLRELLITLALQIGSEVSYSEIANHLNIDRKTVESYIDLLEKTFVIFRLYAYSNNFRNEINRKVKIYFYDLGIRNSLINNFNSFNLRNDSGHIFENFIISEMVKDDKNKPQKKNFYFWRTYDLKEIDLITEINGELRTYEIKLKKNKYNKAFDQFHQTYPNSTFEIINSSNFIDKVFA